MMHLLGPHITTTNYRKRKNKLTQGKMDMYVSEYVERCKRDKRFRLPTVSFDEFVSEMRGGRKKQKKIATAYSPKTDTTLEDSRNHRIMYPSVEDRNVDPKLIAKRENMHYNGERQLLGIFTMHKSNMVPVFADNKEVAIDIARMRR
jgi:hypothetical protein